MFTQAPTYVNKNYQRGAVLIMLLLIVIVGITTAITLMFSQDRVSNKVKDQTYQSLAIAKQALLDYAAMHYELGNPNAGSTPTVGQYGVLPCPDGNLGGTEGIQDGNCSGQDVNALGRLPWRTLGIGPIFDGHTECLWYAVSGPYKKTFIRTALNSDTPGLFNLFHSDGVTLSHGNTPDDRPVAVIFSAGPPLLGQDRTTANPGSVPNCGGHYDASDYLEAVLDADDNVLTSNFALSNNDYSIDNLAQAGVDNVDVINDIAVVITKQELWDAVQSGDRYIDKMTEVTQGFAECLAALALATVNDKLPWPAMMIDLAGATAYYDDANYPDAGPADNIYAGRIPYDIQDSLASMGEAGNLESILFDNGVADIGSDACNQFQFKAGLNGVSRVDNEYYYLWRNWKDHFFYAVGADMAADAGGAEDCDNGGDCINIDGQDFAAVVFFAGAPLAGQQRSNTPDVDTRFDITNYLEGADGIDNPANFFAQSPQAIYGYADSSDTYNDIMFCIDQLLQVNECPK